MITILMIIIFSSIHISNHVYKYKCIITFVEWGQQSNKFIYLNWLGGILEGDNLKLPFPGLSICWSVVLKVLSYCVIIYRWDLHFKQFRKRLGKHNSHLMILPCGTFLSKSRLRCSAFCFNFTFKTLTNSSTKKKIQYKNVRPLIFRCWIDGWICVDWDPRVFPSERDDYKQCFPTEFRGATRQTHGWFKSGKAKLIAIANVVEYAVVLGDLPFLATVLGGSSPTSIAKHAQWRMAKDSSRISCKRPRPPIRAESGKYQLGVLTKTYPHCCEIGGTWGGIGLGDIHLESNQNTVYIYILKSRIRVYR